MFLRAYQRRTAQGIQPSHHRSFAQWIVSAQDSIRFAATAALLTATAITLYAELRSSPWSLPRILYIIGMAVMVGIALRPRSLFLFLVIWTSQHWILATGLASQAPSKELTHNGGLIRRAFHNVNVRPWAILILLMTLSVVLLPLFEVEA